LASDLFGHRQQVVAGNLAREVRMNLLDVSSGLLHQLILRLTPSDVFATAMEGPAARSVGLGAGTAVAERPARTAVGPLFRIIDGPTRGRPWSAAAVRAEFRRLAARAGVRRRFAPHQLRHAHALELAREASR
jgi:integrase